MAPSALLPVRASGRVLLIDPADRVLLLQIRPDDPDAGGVWLTPGGGLERGEESAAAAARELTEETGHVVPHGALMGPVWTRHHRFLGTDLRETYFALRTDRVEVDRAGWTALERAQLGEHRWWSLPELRTATDQRFAPRRIAVLLPAVLAAMRPGGAGWTIPPIEVGV
ncbi:MAG: NUDIX hydrolase [Geodermatophilaceae bacterium]